MTRKNITILSLTYGIITASANLVGVLLPNIFQSDYFTNPAFTEWIDFLSQYTFINNTQYISFLLPVILCISYVAFAGKKIESHIINLPLVYSTIGITGWLFYFTEEIIIIIYAMNQGFNLDISFIVKASLLNVLIESLVTFTFSYFIMETIHRKFVLPKYFSG